MTIPEEEENNPNKYLTSVGKTAGNFIERVINNGKGRVEGEEIFEENKLPDMKSLNGQENDELLKIEQIEALGIVIHG